MADELQTAINVDSGKSMTEPLTGDSATVAFVKSGDQQQPDTVQITGRAPVRSGLTKDELMKYANDPFWIKTRWTAFALYWLVWFGMLFGSFKIIYSADRCPDILADPSVPTIAEILSTTLSPGSN